MAAAEVVCHASNKMSFFERLEYCPHVRARVRTSAGVEARVRASVAETVL
jgi:hypothetical protein